MLNGSTYAAVMFSRGLTSKRENIFQEELSMLKRRTFLGFIAAVLAGKILTSGGKHAVTAQSSTSTPTPETPPAQSTPTPTNIAAFELSELLEEQAESGQAYLPFLEETSMSMGIYSLSEGTRDGQSPHRRDEVYIVLSGEAIIEVDGEDRAVQEGSIIFVAAEVRHRFHTITKDLSVLVFFSSGPTASDNDD
jgi:mannose-6-phosphate isomerase-like protein (cupin superfamily)